MPAMIKGYVKTRCKNSFFITYLVEASLNRLIRDTAETIRGCEDPGSAQFSLQFSFAETQIITGTYELGVKFTFLGEPRGMNISLYPDLRPRVPVVSAIGVELAASNHSSLLIRTALEALSCLGPVYLNENDEQSALYEPLDIKGMNYARAVAKKLVSLSMPELRFWKDAFIPLWGEILSPDELSIPKFHESTENLMGFTIAELNELLVIRGTDRAEQALRDFFARKAPLLGV